MLRVLEKSLALFSTGVKPEVKADPFPDAANTDSCSFLLWPFQKAVSLVHPATQLHSE